MLRDCLRRKNLKLKPNITGFNARFKNNHKRKLQTICYLYLHCIAIAITQVVSSAVQTYYIDNKDPLPAFLMLIIV